MADAAKKENEVSADDQAAKGGQTPSMEEILKSIRGVISGDEGSENSGAAVAAEDDILELTEIAEDESIELKELGTGITQEQGNVDLGGKGMADENNKQTDVAQNTDPAATASPSAPVAEGQEKSILDEIDATLSEEKKEATQIPAEAAKAVVNQTEGEDDDLMSPDKEDVASLTGSSPTSGEKLIKEDVAHKSSDSMKQFVNSIPKPHVDSVYTRGGTTLEDLVVEALKPYLAEWLNKNLPTLVKQIVSKEIKKLVPREDEEQ